MPNVTNQPLQSVAMRWHDTVEATRAEAHPKLPKRDPKVAQTEVQTARNLFGAYFSERSGVLCKELGIPKENQAKFFETAKSALNEIMDVTFKDGLSNSKIKKSEFKEIVKTANLQAQQKLIELNKNFGTPDTTPQIIPFKTSNGETKITVMKPAPPIENLVLRGGGAKGIGNGPALLELDNEGTLAGLKTIIGTSAGALTAVGLSCGMSAAEFNAFADETDIEGLKGSPDNYKTLYPMIDTSLRPGYTAGNALKTLDEVSTSQVKDCLDNKWDAVLNAHTAGTITDAQFNRLRELKKEPNFDADRTGSMVTFGDLKTMSSLFSEFKELTLTGSNRTDGTIHYFNADTTPNMPIAVAGRISMSIPVYFASVDYDAGEGTKKWVDGGVKSNMPSEVIMQPIRAEIDAGKAALEAAIKAGDAADIATASRKVELATKKLNEATARTLLMTFDDGGEAYEIMHDPFTAKTSFGLITNIMGLASGDTNFGLNEEQDKQKMRDAGPNLIVVHHGNIDTTDLDADENRVKEATIESQMRILEQIAMRQNQASHEVFNSAVDVVDSLSLTEMQQIVDAGPPDREGITAKASSPVEAQQLYGLSMDIFNRISELMRVEA